LGGVAIAAVAGVRLTVVNVGVIPSTFEYVAARITTGQSSCLVVVIYRPGSSKVTASFFVELAEVLDCLSTFVDPVILAGDINIRLDRASDANTVSFCDLIASYGLTQLVNDITHDNGGTLDVVCVRDDQPIPVVNVINTGLSDHRLLCWKSSLLRPSPIYVTSTRRPWRSFCHETFRADLQASVLCNQQQWSHLDGDDLVNMYDITVKALLDEQIPVSTKTCRRRPSNVWFDDECRRAKKSLRASERTARRTKQLLDDTIPAVASWRDARRKYFNLLHQSGPSSGDNEWTVSVINPIVYGHHSMRSWAAVRLFRLKLMHQLFIAFLIRRLLMFELLLLALLHLSSILLLLGVSYVYFPRSLKMM
jgi:hypothetical protein